MNKSVKVFIWGKEIGRLAWDNRRHLSYFNFNPAIFDSELNIAPLIASIKDMRSRRPIFGEADHKYQKLPPFIADSLPDDWGNQLFEVWRTENKVANADITPLEKLSFIGKRGMGALEFEPETDQISKTDKIDVLSLVTLAQKIFLQRENLHILPEESLIMQALIAVGISAGGRQPKAIIAINHTTGEIRSGQIAGLKGFDYCILKFGDAVRSSAELEMTYYEMARKAGINMMESRLLQIEGYKHFLTKRFDRDGDKKLHTQTLAALWPEADSYEKLLWVCRKMRLSENDSTEIFRRMVFNVLANNTDDHNKNFTFIMTSNGRWSLAPAYDMTYIFNMGGYLPQQERCLMIRGKITDITKDDILAFASDNGIRKAEAIINDVAKAISSFHTLAVTYGVKDEWIGRVETCLNNHLAEWGLAAFNQVDSYIDGDGHKITNARLEQAYRGNIHLLATIDGHQRKYIIRRGTPLHEEISRMGIVNISPEKINRLVSECLIKS